MTDPRYCARHDRERRLQSRGFPTIQSFRRSGRDKSRIALIRGVKGAGRVHELQLVTPPESDARHDEHTEVLLRMLRAKT